MSAAQPTAKVIDLSEYSIAQLEKMYQSLTYNNDQRSSMLMNMRDTSQKAEKAIEALGCMKEGNEEKDILIPVSKHIMIPGKLDCTDHVFVSVGAGYVVEKTIEDAKTFFSNQLNLLDGTIKTIRSQIMSVEDQMYSIKKVIEVKKIQQQQQQQAVQQS